jgi:hypothetical protein
MVTELMALQCRAENFDNVRLAYGWTSRVTALLAMNDTYCVLGISIKQVISDAQL